MIIICFLSTNKIDLDISHPFYGKSCVFTGIQDKMSRTEAMQCVIDFGGLCENNVTKKRIY